MELIRGLHNLKNHSSCVVTIGNFDGVHKGHQKILNKLVSLAEKKGVPSLVISFSVTPEAFFGRTKAKLSSFRDKHLFLESLGIDKHLLIRFNREFSEVSAESFIGDVLVKRLGIKHCLVGDDFQFGKGRRGDFAMLKKASHRMNFIVEEVEELNLENNRISSSAIRGLLLKGDFRQAEEYLGRPFTISGRISHGDKRGRTIGFPTANIGIRRKISPVLGVYSVVIKVRDEEHVGVCNIGKRPTIGGSKVLLEVFIFNFNEEIYGEYVSIIFKQKCRDEIKFNSFDELKDQIKQDVETSKKYFKGENYLT